MFTDDQFKKLLVKVLDKNNDGSDKEEISVMISKLRISQVSLEVTRDFTYTMGWDTYCTYLRINVPFDSMELFEKHEKFLTETAKLIYGR